jgi:hypothetical protein
MNIEKILLNSANHLHSLANRLFIEAQAVRTNHDREDVVQNANECGDLADGLKAINAAYGPILQCAVDVGLSGKRHKIAVFEERDSDITSSKVWYAVSEHKFTVEKK